MSNGVDETGPIDYLVGEFPNNGMTGEAFPLLAGSCRAGQLGELKTAGVLTDAEFEAQKAKILAG